jgi:hypothetical protein
MAGLCGAGVLGLQGAPKSSLWGWDLGFHSLILFKRIVLLINLFISSVMSSGPCACWAGALPLKHSFSPFLFGFAI